jgi:hypothetical protein
MDHQISTPTRSELVEVLRQRYQKSSKKDKTAILNEFVKLSGYHRKHAIRILGHNKCFESDLRKVVSSKKIYGIAVKEALIVLWEASDRICSKRLKAALPSLIESMEMHGHLNLSPDVRNQLLKISASTIDRLLSTIRNSSGSRRKKRISKKIGGKIPIRTIHDWKDQEPGCLEIDMVVHCGGNVAGSCFL